MRFSVLRENGRNLARGCAVLMVAGVAAGCSSQVARFSDGIDLTSTASTDNQRSIIQKPQAVSQPYPGDTITAAPADGGYMQSVSRSSIEPIKVQPLPPVAQAQPAAAPVMKPAQVASAPVRPELDNTATGTVRSVEKPFKQAAPEAPRMAAEGEPAGWSRAGGTQITIREGETVYNLSRRYGVPASVIMQTNGLASADGLQAGQKVVIPTYVYSRKAPVSAPDSNPNVADARSSRGTKYDVPAHKVPLPARAPTEKVAVLPQQPKLKEQKPTASLDASATSDPQAKPVKQATAATATPGAYTVQPGDTLSAISRKTGASVTALKQANGMQDGLIRIGQTLKIPNGQESTIASAAPAAKAKPALDPVKTASTPSPAKATPSETLASYTPPKKAEKLISQAADDDVEAPDSTGIGKMRWPVRGRVISAYGSGKDSDGIDISVPEGTPVKAAENGVVIYAGDGLKEFGNTVLVRHDDGLVTVYGYASSIDVKRGQKVKRGQEIAQSGMSGSADSPRLHFEVRKNSAPVDPRTFLE